MFNYIVLIFFCFVLWCTICAASSTYEAYNMYRDESFSLPEFSENEFKLNRASARLYSTFICFIIGYVILPNIIH